MQSKSEITASLAEEGIEAPDAARIADLARPSIVFEPGTPAGMTKLGGMPDLPRGADWPMRAAMPDLGEFEYLSEEDRAFVQRPAPLSFIAQFDLGHMARKGLTLPDVPERGVLYVFYDLVAQTWGFDPRHKAGWRIVWHDVAPEGLAPATPPEKLRAIDELPLSARFALDPVDVETQAFGQVASFGDDLRDDYLDWSFEHRANGHKLGGWPNVIQGAMETECALVSNGIYCGDSSGYLDPRAEAIVAAEPDWQLLAQIDSDEDAGMMWGDLGTLYVWIRRRDLVARNFDRCWVILQCS